MGKIPTREHAGKQPDLSPVLGEEGMNLFHANRDALEQWRAATRHLAPPDNRDPFTDEGEGPSDEELRAAWEAQESHPTYSDVLCTAAELDNFILSWARSQGLLDGLVSPAWLLDFLYDAMELQESANKYTRDPAANMAIVADDLMGRLALADPLRRFGNDGPVGLVNRVGYRLMQDSLDVWAKQHISHVLESNPDPVLSYVAHEWRLATQTGVLPIGTEAIMDHLRSWRCHLDAVPEPILARCAQVLSLMDGDERAMLALIVHIGRTKIDAFMLADFHDDGDGGFHTPRNEVRFHVIGDPDNDGAYRFRERVRAWWAPYAGKRGPGRGRGRPKGSTQLSLAEVEAAMRVYLTTLPIGERATKRQFLERFVPPIPERTFDRWMADWGTSFTEIRKAAHRDMTEYR